MQRAADNSASYFQRINVVGTSGSGKSTFSQQLAQTLNLPHIEMDKLFWGPNWTEPSNEEFFPKLEKILAQDGWILDGNYSRTIPVKWPRTQAVIWLDMPFSTTVTQAIKRAVSRAASKQEIWAGTGNVETFRKSFFSRNSIILWTIQTFSKNRAKYERFMADETFSHITFIRLRSAKEARQYLDKLQNSSNP